MGEQVFICLNALPFEVNNNNNKIIIFDIRISNVHLTTSQMDIRLP